LPIPAIRQHGPDETVGVDVVDGLIAVAMEDDQRHWRARVGWRALRHRSERGGDVMGSAGG
jgi:hypothetical protein